MQERHRIQKQREIFCLLSLLIYMINLDVYSWPAQVRTRFRTQVHFINIEELGKLHKIFILILIMLIKNFAHCGAWPSSTVFQRIILATSIFPWKPESRTKRIKWSCIYYLLPSYNFLAVKFIYKQVGNQQLSPSGMISFVDGSIFFKCELYIFDNR